MIRGNKGCGLISTSKLDAVTHKVKSSAKFDKLVMEIH